MVHDLIIVGGGAAGLAGAIFGARRSLSTLVLTEDIGGQAATTEEIENYPGFEKTEGPILTTSFKHQAERDGATFLYERATALAAQALPDESAGYRVTTDRGTHDARALLLAFGRTRRRLQIPGETEFTGRGVSAYKPGDAERVAGQTVAVVGGGNSALTAATRLAEHCPKVYLVNRADRFAGEAITIARANAAPAIERLTKTFVTRIEGQNQVERIIVADDPQGSSPRPLHVQAVFVEIGFDANPELVQGFVDMTPQGDIATDIFGATSQPGVYAAGDCTSIPYRQIVISAGQGATAALALYQYLQQQGVVTKPFTTDWGFRKRTP